MFDEKVKKERERERKEELGRKEEVCGRKRVIGLGCQRVERYSTEIKEKVGVK